MVLETGWKLRNFLYVLEAVLSFLIKKSVYNVSMTGFLYQEKVKFESYMFRHLAIVRIQRLGLGLTEETAKYKNSVARVRPDASLTLREETPLGCC